MFTIAYLCLPLFIPILTLRLLVFTYVHSCLSVYNCLVVYVYLYLPLFLVFTYVYSFFLPKLLVFSTLY